VNQTIVVVPWATPNAVSAAVYSVELLAGPAVGLLAFVGGGIRLPITDSSRY
jgi:hypothetical protein